ncbi:MAG: 4Fe-4S dicluster domain-containing protein [Fibrobacterota bacterium]
MGSNPSLPIYFPLKTQSDIFPHPPRSVPSVTDACLQCAGCVAVCAADALRMKGLSLEIDVTRCNGCSACVRFCPAEALIQ